MRTADVRRNTRAVKAGKTIIGGGFPVLVQTMWKEPLSGNTIPGTLAEIGRLSAFGCDIIRFAVPDSETADLIGRLAGSTEVPLVADIHFDYRLALQCLDYPIAKIRINPGNIGEEWKVREVVEKAAGKGISLRIGVNSGSLPRSLAAEKDVAHAMVEAAEAEIGILERLGFRDAVFSLKSSDVQETIRANVMFASKCDYPLHLGITEAGPLIPGLIKNTLGIASLLEQGIGDTIRVSLTDSPVDEVIAGLEILRAIKLRDTGASIVSCPKCGRSSFDVKGFLEDVSDFIHTIRKPVTIAVMGCVVNGPGEARRCDVGITGAGRMAIIFRSGNIVRRVPFEGAVEAFKEEVREVCGLH
jgi:(E)-4-hydroxy-3-methylbut-2-enyl-diphosphate synthase